MLAPWLVGGTVLTLPGCAVLVLLGCGALALPDGCGDVSWGLAIAALVGCGVTPPAGRDTVDGLTACSDRGPPAPLVVACRVPTTP